MSARYLDIRPLQIPFEREQDADGRSQVTFNVAVTKTPSTTVEEEIFQILSDANVTTKDKMYGSKWNVLPKTGDIITVIVNSGLGVLRTQNESAPAYHRPAIQITARAGTYEWARTLAWAAYDALAVVRNQVITVS